MDDALDDVLVRALAPLFADLKSSGVAPPRVEPDDWPWDDRPAAMLISPDGSGTGISVDRTGSEAERVVDVAEQVQEWTIEEQGRLLAPTNWPVCPRHPDNHPMESMVRDGVAVWACPVDWTPITPIGAL